MNVKDPRLNDAYLTNLAGRHHFHTFDALRFFAFLKVFLLHLPITSYALFNYAKAGGGIGVHFFFSLSGFLITYIICDEKLREGKLNLKNFFARRVLRIWPLFYLMILVAFLTPVILQYLHLPSSSEGYEPDWMLSLLFLENYKIMFSNGLHPNVSPLGNMWSLCVEEHFYIIWGFLLYFLKPKALPLAIIISLIVAPVCRIIYSSYGIPSNDIFTHIDLFAWGAVPAYFFVYHKEKIIRFIDNIAPIYKIAFLFVLLFSVFIFSQYAKNERVLIWGTSVLGLLFGVFIILILSQNSYYRIGDKNIFSRLGIFTYGLYLYHSLAINLLKQLCYKFHIDFENDIVNTLLFITLSFLLSLFLSFISFHFFEKQFLKLKKFFRT